MKAYVYILQGDNGKYYVGSTTDIDRRIAQHNSGHTYTTARMGSIRLVFTQRYDTVIKARMIEKKLKSWKRKDYLDKIIKEGVINFGA